MWAMSTNDRKPKLPGALNLKLAVFYALGAAPLLFCSAAAAENAQDVRVSPVGDFNETIKKGYTPVVDFGPPPSETGLNTEGRPIKIGRNAKISDVFGLLDFYEVFGLDKEGLLKRFPPPKFKHTANFSEITWHGTDVSSVLELRFKKGKVSAVRLSTHYGYPRPGTTSDVEVGKWQSAPIKIRR